MRCVSISAVLIFTLAGSAFAATYIVNPDGTGDYPTIQHAVQAANDGDTIALTDGTFTGHGNRNVSYLGKAITIESLSGNPATCIMDCEGSAADPARAFEFSAGEPEGAALVGVTIAGGWMTDSPAGGAILCVGPCSPSITNCRFVACRDCAILCTNGSRPHISECFFYQNEGLYGGGIGSEEGHPTITDCEFLENTAYMGGGVHGHAGTIEVTDCTFLGNTATSWGGGLGLLYSCVGTITGCWFEGNAADDAAGALNIHFAEGVIHGCTFVANTAPDGGAFASGKVAFADLTHCTFWGNISSSGAALFCGEYQTTLENTVIAFNGPGSAIANAGDVILTCCDIYGNAGGDWVYGLEEQLGIDGNIAEDPLFCDPEDGDFTLHDASPCAPFTPPNPECDLIGAWPIGCDGTPVERLTWGAITGLFRQ